MTNEPDDSTVYAVVINDEEQYSIWPHDRPIPMGWKDVGVRGPKAECLTHIEKVWTDMRPLNVRRAIAEAEARPAKPVTEPSSRRADEKDDLVGRLEAEQPIAFVGRPSSSLAELQEQVQRGRVFVVFEATGTELGIKLTGAMASAGEDAVRRNQGRLHIEGDLVLNFNRVRFVGDLDLGSLRGEGCVKFLGLP